MTKYNIKLASKILFGVVAVLLLFRIVSLTFKEDMEIESKEVKVYEVSQDDIISSGKEIVVKSFDVVDSVKWINSTELLINGSIDDDNNKYLFTMDEKELKKYNGDYTEEIKDYSLYEFIEEIPGYGALCIKGNSIGLITSSNEFNVIAEDASYDGEIKYTLSENLSKLSYYHNSKKQIFIYSFEKDSFKSIKDEVSGPVVNNFNEYVKLSPLGGYLSVEYRTDELSTSTFSIFGADSGKVYANDVMGVKLSWSADDSKVCYYYTESSEMLNGDFYDNDVQSKRIGYYDVLNKKIDYIDSTDQKKNMISKIYWSDKSISALIGFENEENNLVVEKVLEYKFDERKFNEITLTSPQEISVNSKIELINLGDSYILVIDSSSTYKIMKILKDSSEIVLFEDLKMMNINNEEFDYYYNDGNSLILADEELITISKPNFQGFIHLIKGDYSVYPSENMDYIAVWFRPSNEIRILTTN